MAVRLSAWAAAGAAALLLLAAFSTRSCHSGERTGSPRVISLYAAHTEILLRLGARDNLIGVSNQETYSGPETAGWNPPTFSARDDVEKFLAARPDIVLARPQHMAAGSRLRQALEKAGVRVVAAQVVAHSDLYPYWRALAELVDRKEAAERMIQAFETAIRPIALAAEQRTRKPGVFIEAIHREIKTFTPDSLPYWLVKTAGGRNIAADADAASPGVIIADFGPERLLARADEVDVLISQQGAMNHATLDAVIGRPLYRPLKAVRTGHVHKIAEAVLARPTPSLVEGLTLLAGWLDSTAQE